MASIDLDQIELYIKRNSYRAAVKTVIKIMKAVERLKEHPGLGRPGRVDGTKELVISNLPYIIPYRVKDKTIEILRVFHTSRKWNI